MRLIVAIILLASLGCGDDDGGLIDGGPDAATDAGDADVPAMDGRVTDGSDEDASDLSDAGDAGDAGEDGGHDAGACLEPSYVWAPITVCTDETVLYTARRVTLNEFCERYECPADWDAALAISRPCDDDEDAGPGHCWTASSECGANLLTTFSGHSFGFLYYDQATGELRGAAFQFTDSSSECEPSETIAGDAPPICCPDAGP